MTFDTFVSESHFDIAGAIARLEVSAAPAPVASAYDAFLRDAYWKLKRIDLVSALAAAGITFCQQHAAAADEERAKKDFLSTAKTLAYNLASFTWPGWDEPGIGLTPELIAQGLAGARLNLQLAHELHKPPDKVRNAHWLLGAHLLGAPHAGHLAEALAEFELACPPPPIPAPPEDEFFQTVRGYMLLARWLETPAAAEAAWTAHLETLACRADDAAKFVRAQLVTAHRVFTR